MALLYIMITKDKQHSKQKILNALLNSKIC